MQCDTYVKRYFNVGNDNGHIEKYNTAHFLIEKYPVPPKRASTKRATKCLFDIEFLDNNNPVYNYFHSKYFCHILDICFLINVKFRLFSRLIDNKNHYK